MKQTIPWLTLLWLLAAHGALADKVAANACAATLPPHARLVFDAVIARPHPELTLRAEIEARVRELIFMDRMMIGAAQPAAEAASLCLRISRNCTGGIC